MSLKLKSRFAHSGLADRSRSWISKIGRSANLFHQAEGGNFGIITAFALIPIMIVAGGAVDVANSQRVRSSMQAAADAAVLAATSKVEASSHAERQALADQIFQYNLGDVAGVPNGTLVETNGVYDYQASHAVENRFLKLAQLSAFDVEVSSQASPDGKDLDIVFVLDNSGSMKGERLAELKNSVALFLDTFKETKGRVQAAVVPFHSGVRISSTNLTNAQTNLNFIDCKLLENNQTWKDLYGPLCWSSSPGFKVGTAGAYYSKSNSKNTDEIFQYTATSANGRTRIVADRGTCTDSNRSNKNRGDRCYKYTHQTNNFLVYDQPSKQTCVVDRDQPFDTTNDAPDREGRKYPTSRCDTNEIGEVRPLDANLTSVNNAVRQLTAEGSTNLTIGVQWGMEALSPTFPLSGRRSASAPIMIILSDGRNQMNRWGYSHPTAPAIDARTRLACRNAKSLAVPIEIYAVNLIDGDPDVLRECASGDSHYYAVDRASELREVFATMATRIQGIRLIR